jgi:starch phosphorylase
MQIVYQINRLHLDAVCALERSDGPPLAALSLIDDNAGRRLRMSSLAFVGSHKVNGVSALHTELMRQTVFRELHQMYPDRIVNKTNGITMRRWLFAANPGLTSLLTEVIGERVLSDANALADFARAADDSEVHERLRSIRRANKQGLGRLVAERLGVQLDPDALFDVHIKRIHEYKRQLLNILETIALYNEMRARPLYNWVPRVKIFAGKAASSYRRAS